MRATAWSLRQVTTKVVSGAGDCRDRQAGDAGDLVVAESLVTDDHSGRRASAIPDHFDWDVVIDPCGAMQRRGGYTCDDRPALRPQPRSLNPVAKRDLMP